MPRFSADEAVQWLVEEALMERLDAHDRELQARAYREQATRAAERRAHEANERRRQTR